MTIPLVSICSITYNHAPFIRQCLDGFLMQQCNFPIEIIINDDCSTDGTTEIIREYAEKYPDKIFPIFHEENQYSKGVRGMFQKFVFPKARGKYIALCEGDDYWTDPLKLQKQVDFLESHPDYSMCFHGCKTVRSDGTSSKLFHFLENREYTKKEIITRWCVPTASLLYRSEVIHGIPRHDKFCVGDNVIVYTCLLFGRVYCFGDQMSVYRIHDGGWTQSDSTCQSEMMLQHYSTLIDVFPVKYRAYLQQAKSHFYWGMARLVYKVSYFQCIRVLLRGFYDSPLAMVKAFVQEKKER